MTCVDKILKVARPSEPPVEERLTVSGVGDTVAVS
jgi:hypothetical protein